MSLGDGLICTDANYLITVCNFGAAAIFGYQPAEMIGRPFDNHLCARSRKRRVLPFSIRDAPLGLAQGTVIEFEGRRSNGESFPVEASFSGWQGADGFQYGAVLRDISVRKREAEKIRYLAEHDTLTGLANRYTLDRPIGRDVPAPRPRDARWRSWCSASTASRTSTTCSATPMATWYCARCPSA